MRNVFGKITEKLNISGRDAKLFIVSLLLAYSIWLIHYLSLNYTEIVRVPVQAQCDINGHAFQSSNTSVAMARCRATGFGLIQLERAENQQPVVIRFNSSDMHRSSEEMYYITSDELNKYAAQIFGTGTKLETFLVDTLSFRFPFENHKRVPVQPVYSLSFKPQYINVGTLSVSPDSVTIYGEPFHLSGIDRVYTESLTLNDLDSSAHGEAKLDKIKGVRMSDATVRYRLNVSRFVEVKVQIPVDTRNVPRGKSLIIYPSVAEVTFHCAFPISSAPTDDVKVYVDYNDFTQSLKGQCLPRMESVPVGVLDYTVSPEVFDCVESGK